MGERDAIEECLQHLRDASSLAEVNAVAKSYGAQVREWAGSSEWKVRAIHIKNLAAYRRNQLSRREGLFGR